MGINCLSKSHEAKPLDPQQIAALKTCAGEVLGQTNVSVSVAPGCIVVKPDDLTAYCYGKTIACIEADPFCRMTPPSSTHEALAECVAKSGLTL